MGHYDNVTNKQHWESLVRKAERGWQSNGWNDFHLLFDPIFYTRHGLDSKGVYRRIFQVPFLYALFGDDLVESRWYDKSVERYKHICHEVVELILTKDDESPVAFLDRQKTKFELDEEQESIRVEQDKKQVPAGGKE